MIPSQCPLPQVPTRTRAGGRAAHRERGTTACRTVGRRDLFRARRSSRASNVPLEPRGDLGPRGDDRRRLRGVAQPRAWPVGQPASARAGASGRRLGTLGQRLVPKDRGGGLLLAFQHPRVLPALSTARRDRRSSAGRALPGCGCPRLGGSRSGSVRAPSSPGSSEAGRGGRAASSALPRALPDEPLPHGRLQRGTVPRARARRLSSSPSGTASAGSAWSWGSPC